MIGIKLVTAYSLPSSGHLSLTRAKEHLRVTGTSEDGLITGYLWAAIRYVEERAGRAMLSSTWRQTLDRFPRACGLDAEPQGYGCAGWSARPIFLARNPVIAVTGLSYKDAAGTTRAVSLSDLLVETDCEPARVSPVVSGYWPYWVLPRPGTVSVTFTAGYATNADIPEPLVQAVYVMLGHFYENRETVIVGSIVNNVPFGVDALLGLSGVPWLDYEV